MFTTYRKTGKASDAHEEHRDIKSALAAWLNNCGSLTPESGEESRLVDDDRGGRLVWLAAEGGGCVGGNMAKGIADAATPAAIAKGFPYDRYPAVEEVG